MVFAMKPRDLVASKPDSTDDITHLPRQIGPEFVFVIYKNIPHSCTS